MSKETLRRTITLSVETDNKLAYLQNYDIKEGRKTVSKVIEELINSEYDRVKPQ